MCVVQWGPNGPAFIAVMRLVAGVNFPEWPGAVTFATEAVVHPGLGDSNSMGFRSPRLWTL